MAALDVSGFISPPTTFEGLDNLTNTLVGQRREKAYMQHQREAKAAASTKFFSNYLDDKEKFTGTKYDPINHELLSGALNDAMELIKQGSNDTDIMAAISPKVNKASNYAISAQTYAANKKAYIDRLRQSGTKGIDFEKLNSEIDNQAFPEGADLDKVDPSVNYGDMALKNGDVYNAEGFDDDFTKAPKNTEVGSVKYINKKGGFEKGKVKLTAPYYAQSEKDADGNHVGFVPKYQIATDGGNELLHEFETEQGKENAPVRLFDKDLFDALPASQKAYLLQETRKYAKQKGVDLSSVQAENFARALAYDEKKARINGTYEHVDETKENPAPRISIRVGETRSEKKQAETRDRLYKSLDNREEDDNGNIDVTDIYNSVVVRKNSKGKGISQGNIMYNHKDKTITYDDGDEKITKPVYEVATMAASANPTSDINLVTGLNDYIRNSDKKVPENKTEKDYIKSTKSFFKNLNPFGKSNQPSAPKAKEAKKISANTVKSLVGKKGYEGYTESELIDYYKSNGYEVE